MAFSAVTERGSASEKVSDASLGVSPSAAITVDKIVFAVLAFDNIATADGASTTNDTLTDTDGHTWTKVFEFTNTAGVANDGVTGSLWWTKVTSEIGTGDTVTFNVDSAVTAKTIGLFEVTVGAGQTIQFVASDIAATDPGFTSRTLSGLTSKEYLFLGLAYNESNVLTWTEDSDYTNVYAAEGIGSSGGGAGSNVSINVGYRIATLTGDTFLPGGASSAEHVMALLAFEEVSAGGTTVTPAVVAVVTTVPTPTILAAATVTPAVVATVTTVPTPTVLAASTVTPAVVALVVTVPTPTVAAASVVTPAVVALVVTVPTPTVTISGAVTPAVVAVTITVPTPTIQAAATVTPAVVALVVTVPTPTVVGGEFGQTYVGTSTVGGSNLSMVATESYVKQVSLQAGWIVSHVEAFIRTTDNEFVMIHPVIYLDNAGDPGDMVVAPQFPGSGVEFDGTDRWWPMATGYAVPTTGDYWVGIHARTAGSLQIAHDSGSDREVTSGGAWVNEAAGSGGGLTSDGRDYSIRASIIAPTTITQVGRLTTGASNLDLGAEVRLIPVTITAGKVLLSVEADIKVHTANTPSIRGMLYSDNAGVPGIVLHAGPWASNAMLIANTYRRFSFPMGRWVESSADYWIGVQMGDTGSIHLAFDGTGGSGGNLATATDGATWTPESDDYSISGTLAA